MQVWAEIKSNSMVAPGYFLMEIVTPDVAKKARPGQFLHVKTSAGIYPLLRRPISLHDINPGEGTVGLLYQVRGVGTEQLSQKRPGDALDIMGPLGKGFDLDVSGDQVLVVGGGIGVAPLFPLAQELVAKGKKVTVLLGARTRDTVLADARFAGIGCQVEIITDDGTCKLKGYVTDLLENQLRTSRYDYLYACGPEPMLARVDNICQAYQLAGQVSLEAYMGCGVGACLSCACEKMDTAGKQYAKVCLDGPVFQLGEVKIHG